MRPRPFLLLLAGFALALMAAGEADATEAKEPLWSCCEGTSFSVAISTDGEYIATGGQETISLFGKDSNTPLWSFTNEEDASFLSVSISGDGEYIAAGDGGGRVYLFDKDSSTPLWSYDIGGNVRSVAISADGEYVAAGNWNNGDSKVYLFDKDSSTPLWSYTTESNVLTVAISADGEYIAAGSYYKDAKVYLFDKDSSTPLWSYDTGSSVYSVAISTGGEYVVAGTDTSGGDGLHYLYLFDIDSGTALWNYTTGGEVRSLAVSADGEYIAAGTAGEDYANVHLFDKDSSTPLWSYATGGSGVYTVGISADGEYIVAGFENTTSLFDKNSGTPLWNYTTEGFCYVGSVAISSNGEYVAAGTYGTRTYSYLFSTNALPTADIVSVEPPLAGKEAIVVFSGSSSDSDGNVVAYLWESSIDGNLSTEEDFSSSDLSLGYHNITFRVQDDDGEWSTEASASLFVGIAPIPKAGVDVKVEPNTEIQFTGSGTDEDGTIVNYEWDLNGDGVYDWSSTLNGITTHIYNSDGTYTAVLRLTDDDGITATDSRVITVGDGGGGGGDDGGGGIPAPSLAAAVAAVAVIALRRRR